MLKITLSQKPEGKWDIAITGDPTDAQPTPTQVAGVFSRLATKILDQVAPMPAMSALVTAQSIPEGLLSNKG